MKKSPRILSIIVTYNGSHWIRKCLNSLLLSTIQSDILVVDNASSDDTVKIIKEDFSSISLVESQENLGFGRANNIGINKAIQEDYDYVFLLNQDAWLLTDSCLFEMLKVFKTDSKIGICSPTQFCEVGKLDLRFSDYVRRYSVELHDDYLLSDFRKDTYEVYFANAASWLMSMDCIRTVGCFSPLFNHYGEDNDYANRIHFHDYKMVIAPDAKVMHDRPQKRIGDLPDEKYLNHLRIMYVENLSNINQSLIYQVSFSVCIAFVKVLKLLFSNKFSKMWLPVKGFISALKILDEIINHRKAAKQIYTDLD